MRPPADPIPAVEGEGPSADIPPVAPPVAVDAPQGAVTPPAPLMDPPPVAAGLVYYAVWLPAPQGGVAGPPIYLPAPRAMPGAIPGQGAFPSAPPAATPPTAFPVDAGAPSPAMGAAAHNQRLLVLAIVGGVLMVHLPWVAYLVAVHGCWGTFIEACWPVPLADLAPDADPFAETLGDPYLFARIVFLMLRVQAVISSDWAEYSQAMQLSTGLGSFVLTRIVASNGLVTQGRDKAIYLAALCFVLFLLLFWAELHLTSDSVHPLLGDDTVLDYISQTLPPDFASYGSVRDGLMQLLQFLRLADALILGACLALPATQRKPA